MDGFHDLRLVILALVVAVIASYTALDLAGRVSPSRGKGSWYWLLGGAFSMGIGIWTMHFIAMLAFHLPTPLAYDLGTTVWSLCIAIVVSGFALLIMRRPVLSTGNLSVSAALMGIGICGMHYTGMAAMQMSPPIQYNPPLFIASVMISIAASMSGLYLAFKLRHGHSSAAVLAKLASAVIMGIAIAGMHFTGMTAAHFAPDSVCLAADSLGGMNNGMLAFSIGTFTLCILFGTIVIAAFDSQFAIKNARLADSLQHANQQLQNVALYDKLTGLPNRTLLDDRVDHALRVSQRERKSFAILFTDLDNFKPVNDSFGHHVGDKLLGLVARRLQNCVRNSDTVARAGGDEFIIVLPHLQNPRDAQTIGEKLVGELAKPFAIDGRMICISCSIGISVYPRDGTDAESLMVRADIAMYDVKKAGRNGLRFFDTTMSPPTAAGKAEFAP